ncbi:glycerophosphoryl diester phosphodiesterase [Friedmanniella luteola]|uniref:Glycerophosphoryl diester phosphodiesterase n=1 Tax=Friedmanniella luteola TaxID=546871 RepID=A0A1H1LPA3_9ACTN|nr:glycerophosphodiester phosphodiesterase family protein [Friedmanniella luteola]SDR76207.1 glycerophosphoryl diester phosphodiesterase [Friedmanniella luteola]
MTSAPTRPPGSLSRRALLGGLLAGAATAAVGCAPSRGDGPAATVKDLLAQRPFYVAHRGGGGNWPEMTAYAYEQSSRLPGLHALEISVCLSADGVLVCSHDPSTARVTGVDHDIATTPWSTLSALQVSAARTTDPTQPSRPLTRFDDVVDAYADRFVLFVEPKVPAAAEPLMARLVGLGQPERVVWKQYVNSALFERAKGNGFGTWGYVLDQPSHLGANLERYAAAAHIDMLGVPREQPDAFVSAVTDAAVRNGKPAVMWALTSDEDRARALRLGCQGLMTSNIAGLLPPA